MDTSQFGYGAVRMPEEKTARHYRLAATPTPVIDWHKYPRQEFLPILNQGSSLSCTAHATAYYCMALDYYQNGGVKDTYSRRFIYSQTHLATGGAYIADAMSIPIKVGLASELSVPDIPDESTERDNTLNGTAKITAKAFLYAQVTNNHDIDYLASVIDRCHGFVTGFDLDKNTMSQPEIIIPASAQDAHCVFGFDYMLRPNGKKSIKSPNSWGPGWGDRGYLYIDEDFVKSPYMFDVYTYARIQDLDPTSMKMVLATDPRNPNKVYALVEAPTKQKLWIPNPQVLQAGTNAGLWGSFPDIQQKDLTVYAEGVVQISVSQ